MSTNNYSSIFNKGFTEKNIQANLSKILIHCKRPLKRTCLSPSNHNMTDHFLVKKYTRKNSKLDKFLREYMKFYHSKDEKLPNIFRKIEDQNETELKLIKNFSQGSLCISDFLPKIYMK